MPRMQGITAKIAILEVAELQSSEESNKLVNSGSRKQLILNDIRTKPAM